MCGIIGIVQKNKPIEPAVLQQMQNVIAHRGPDDSGLECLNLFDDDAAVHDVGVAFDRLSIRDLSANGHQPMFNEAHDVMIAFNGEIYNSEELRPLLIQKGVLFKGGSDTEVLLHLYIHFGLKKALSMLDGMFAICIIDRQKSTMYLIRDRIGEKPLYYYQSGDLLLFASEYKAFYCHPDFYPEVNKDAIHEYFLFRYVSGQETFLKDVYNVEPGHYLAITKDEFVSKCYWEIPDYSPNNMSIQECKTTLKDLIHKSVKRRLISDRPLGVQLSGGVDSSYLVSVIKQESSALVHSFGVTFENENYNEEPFMDFVNSQNNCVAHKYMFKDKDFFSSWKQAIWHFEAPMNHEGTLALLRLNEFAKQDVSVLLCGDGPDECLGGYSYYPTFLRCLESMSACQIKTRYYGRKFYSTLFRKPCYEHKDLESIFIYSTQLINDAAFKKLAPYGGTSKDINAIYKKRKKILEKNPGNSIRKYMNYDMRTYMQDILMRTDKISMASAMEVRVPYLMPELIEFYTTIPTDYLVDANLPKHSKYILKELCEEVYGKDFTYRSKMGFGFPMWDFFTSKIVEEYVESVCLPNLKNRGILNFSYLESLWNKRYEFKKHPDKDAQEILWCAVSLDFWMQMYIDSSPCNFTEYYYNKRTIN